MAALAKEQTVRAVYGDNGFIAEYEMVASDTVFKGGIVGLAAAGTVAPSPVGGDNMAGIALETVDNETGAASAKKCKVLIGAVIEVPYAAQTIAIIGDPVFAKTDNVADLSLTSSGAYDQLGFVVAVPATGTLHVRMLVPGEQVNAA